MNYHIISTSRAGHGAVFTNEKEARIYQKNHPGSTYRCVRERLPSRIPPVDLAEHHPTGDTFSEQKKESGPEVKTHSDDPVVVYTDGSSLGNPGPGGYGVVIRKDGQTLELAQGYRHTTNNRMEMLAVITALAQLAEHDRHRRVEIHSDSQYTLNGITKGWAKGWRRRGWKKSDGKPALNPDLWQRMLELTEQFPRLTFKWVRGHAGNPLNERADHLANTAAQGGPGHDMKEDTGYRR